MTRASLEGACLALLTLLSPLTRAGAQGAPPIQNAELTAAERAAVIDSTAKALEALYVSPDTGRLIANHIRTQHRRGAYDALRTRGDFAAQLTRDLRAINADGHLAVDPVPAMGGGRGRGAGPGGDLARRSNYNFERVERLGGNVGYLRMSGFAGAPEAFQVAENALRFLAASDAVILDLRNSRGGSPQMANFLISHFMGPDTVLSLGIYSRAENDTVYRWTMAEVPGPRRPDVPLFILVDGVTRSAAEDVTFVLHEHGRATTVGERTAGAGHMVTGVPVGSGLMAIMSVTRVFDPRTGREWERTGVPVDVQVPAAEALTTAHALALERLSAAEQDALRKQELTLIREAVLAKAKASVPEAVLRQYVGDYGGGGLVSLIQGQLVQQTRRDQPRVELVPLSETRFAAGAVRIEFVHEGGRHAMRVTQPDGSTVIYAPQVSQR